MLGSLIADGRTSTVYRYGDSAAVKVLKLSTPADWAACEAEYARVVRRVGIPAPEVLDLVDVGGRPGIVFRRIDGPSMWQRMVDHPTDIDSMVVEMVGLQRAIHAADVPDGLPSLVERIHVKLDAAPELSAADRAAAHDVLDQLPVGAAVLHGDLHPGNVLLGPDGPVALDWFDASVGHPAADAARSSLLLTPLGATDLRHLPGATADTIGRVHAAYLRAAESLLGDEEVAAGWRRLSAASRLAERTDAETGGLLRLWRSNAADQGRDRSNGVVR